MKTYEATELAYKNGYEKGKQDAVKWIPVTERLPENKQTVLAIRKDGSMFIGYYLTYIDTGRWHIWTARNSTKQITQIVTHWMPLPEPPKGSENNGKT